MRPKMNVPVLSRWSLKQVYLNTLYFFFIFVIFVVIQALAALVSDPEPEHPLRGDLAELFTKDKKAFLQKAADYTKKHAETRPPEWVIDNQINYFFLAPYNQLFLFCH